jgi:hypothetical protein
MAAATYMRTSLLILLFPLFALAQSPTLSPAAPVASAGQSVTITSSTNVTWSLAGSGTLSNQTPFSVTYTAPASVIPQSQMLGCPVFPNDSVFNTRVDALPVNANSATWIAHMSTLPISILPSWGITYADASTPLTNIKPYYGNGSTYPTYSIPFPGRGPGLKRENGNYVGVNGYSNPNDHHTLTVRKNDCSFFEYYDDRTNWETFTCADGVTPGCNANSVNEYGWASGVNPYAMPQETTDAAGLPLAALSYHLDEVKSGVIKHAIRFTASIGYIDGVTWPAVTQNAAAPNSPPYGARFILKTAANGGPNITTVCTSNSVLNQDCVTMLTALQQYGMMLADIGGNNQLEAATDLSEDATTRAAMILIMNANITPASFQAVDESSLQPQTSNGFVTSNSYEVDPGNGYVTPSTYALITATPTAGSVVKVPVALQGTSIGLKSNTLTIQAGTWGSYQIQSWVNPSTLSQSVTWTLASGVGSITSGGLYTPPTTTSGGNTAVLKATAAADSNAVAYVYVTVLPTGSNPTGAIRIDTGSTTGVTDGNSNVWAPDAGMETGISNTLPSDYPSWSLSNPEHAVYESSIYTYGHDIVYNLVLPNGNYKCRFMLGQAWNGLRPPYGSFPESLTSSPSLFESQGIVRAHFYDWNWAANFQVATPTDVVIPATVINNTLVLAERSITPDTAITVASGLAPLYNDAYPHLLTELNNEAKSSSLNGLEIIPDSSTPHWAIDTQQMTSLKAGQSVQLYVVDWYTGDSDVNSPTWSLQTTLPGVSISSTGILSLAAGSYFNGQPIVVKAAGANHSATATLYTAGVTQYSFLPARPPFHYFFKRSLTVSPATGTSLTNFPIVVSFSDPTLAYSGNGGHVQNANGYDIVPSTDSTCATNNLSFEVDTYDPVGGTWIAHVRMPSLTSSGTTTLTLCYGNEAVTSNQATPAAVWDSNYSAVYHFGTLTADSTSNANNTTNSAVLSTTGYFGEGASYAGVNGQYLEVPIVAQPSTKGTFEAWVYNTSGQTNTNWGVYSNHETGDLFQFGVYYDSQMLFGWYPGTTDDRLTASTSQVPMGNTWNHLVYAWDATANSQAVYLNGVPVVTSTTPFTTFVSTQVGTLGADSYNGFKGVLDEVRISNIARSAGWVATEYSNQSSPSTFVVVGSEQHN